MIEEVVGVSDTSWAATGKTEIIFNLHFLLTYDNGCCVTVSTR